MPLEGTPVVAFWTSRRHGDQRRFADGGPAPAPAPSHLALRRLHQVHGDTVVVADSRPASGTPPDGDALVARRAAEVLAILTADCAAVALGSPEGVHGAVHVGWRGLVARVLERSLEAMAGLGATAVAAGVGPCIGPCCYEFSGEDLDAVAARLGPGVRSTTTWGTPSLDLPAALRAALAAGGVALVHDDMRCTACRADAYSHRRHRDDARQALLVWTAP